MRLVAISEHDYPPQTHREIGDEYDEVTKGDGVVLVAARLAKPAPEGITVAFREAINTSQYQTKEQNPTPLATDKPVRKKRQYKRRDMNPQ